MKRGFEENVPKVRPRVRLGRALDEQYAEAQEVAESESAAPPVAPAVHDGETIPPPPLLAGFAHEARQAAQARDESDQAAQARDGEAGEDAPARRDAVTQAELRQEAEARFAEASAARAPESPSARAPEGTFAQARLLDARRRAEEASLPPAAPEPAAPRKKLRPGTAAQEVAELARELTVELNRAGETNARLKADLDAALSGLRQAAEESREQRDEAQRLSGEVEKRALAARDLLAELELLEAERDGALAQAARLTRELREEKARAAAGASDIQRARAEVQQAREAAQRQNAELAERTRERDQAREELLLSRSERDRLADELLAATADAEEAAQSRSALEEIHQALAEARTRITGLR